MLESFKKAVAVVITVLIATGCVEPAMYTPNPDIGIPSGLIPDCPGVLKNASISPQSKNYLQVSFHRVTSSGQIVSKMVPIEAAIKAVTKDKTIDLKNKKTVFYAVGYFDSSVWPFSRAIGTAYSRRGYNVLITETFAFLTHIYPKSARLVQVIGHKIGEFLVKLTHLGLSPENLELVGTSLGAHVIAHAAKYFYLATGKKPSRLTGLDPAGPCYRALGPEHKLWYTDAEKVDVIHTNIDGFGIAERLGHIDIYVNGGEYQPSDIPFIPCLVLCSHIRSMMYWWQAIEHPRKFVGARCDSIQSARLANCTNSSDINYMGIEAKFDKPGIYYLPTNNEFPYFMGKEGLKAKGTIYTRVINQINSEDELVV